MSGFPINLIASGGFPISEALEGWPVETTDLPAFPCTLVASGGYPVVIVNGEVIPYEGSFSLEGDFSGLLSLEGDFSGYLSLEGNE